MRISLRTVLIALVALVAIGGLLSSGALSTVSESPSLETITQDGTCQSDGISLVIEYGTDREPTTTCAIGFSGSGWDLFAATGQKVEGTTDYPVGFVCKINGYPGDQSCATTPSSDQGSWAYYYSTFDAGSNWKFSTAGASMRKPKCGDMDGWVFLKMGEKAHPPTIKPRPTECKQ